MTAIAQRSLAGGELAPALYARSDQTKYATGLRTCRNFMVMRAGGITNRPGTMFVCEQGVSATRGRLAKFVFNASQTYVLLFESAAMRVIQNGALLESSPGVPFVVSTPYATADLPLLKFSQSGDIITITHRNYPPIELSRTGHTAWALNLLVTAPLQVAPTSLTNSGAAGPGASVWVVTAVNAVTLEESLQSALTSSTDLPTTGAPITVSWAAAAGAGQYNVYRQINGINGFIGIAGATSFVDNGIAPDTSSTPPMARTPFVGGTNYPATSGYWQQRHMFGNTVADPETLWGSKSANFRNFSISSPLQDDDAVTFTLAGSQVQAVQHILSLGQLIVLTDSGEWVIQGDGDGVLRPNAINAKQEGYTGASPVQPIVIGNNAIYIQARGNIVHDLRYELQSQGYTGKDLSVFSSHLFEGRTLQFMDYQQVPNSIAWLIRDDGTLLGLTYLREHEIWGWHRHDTDGVFEDVVCVPEGNEDAVYVIVKRTINGVIRRYVERFYTRRVTDVTVDARFVDCGLSYDGRNTHSGMTMILTGGTTWQHGEDLMITASTGFFSGGDVGNAIVLKQGADKVMVMLTSYTSPTIMHCNPVSTVPPLLRSLGTTVWSRAVDDLSGLGHLEGKHVSILADGNVIANGVDTPLFTVTGGALSPSLSRPYSVIHVGLPYVSDIETLDLDPAGGQESLRGKPKLAHNVILAVQDTRGMFVGQDFDHLLEAKPGRFGPVGVPISPTTGNIDVAISSTWNDNGRIVARQKDPLPATILAVVPNYEIGEQTR